MRLQQFGRRCGSHLARNDAGEILFHGQDVDGGDLVGLHHEAQGTVEGLCLFPLPVEVFSYGHVVK